MACCSSSKPSWSEGKSPAKTCGCGLWKPGRGGCTAPGSHRVSPTHASWMAFMPSTAHPTMPGPSDARGVLPRGRISSTAVTV